MTAALDHRQRPRPTLKPARHCLGLVGLTSISASILLIMSGGASATEAAPAMLDIWGSITAVAGLFGGGFSLLIWRMISQYDAQITLLHSRINLMKEEHELRIRALEIRLAEELGHATKKRIS
jgi:hypothetical protein